MQKPNLFFLVNKQLMMALTKVGQMLGALLMVLVKGTFHLKLKLTAVKYKLLIEVDGGLQTVELGLPAIITTDLRLNEPRYTLQNIMQAL